MVRKTWSHTVSQPGFRRRLRELHPAPPALGFLHNRADERSPCFIPTAASSFSLVAPDRRFRRAPGCRHGRAPLPLQGRVRPPRPRLPRGPFPRGLPLRRGGRHRQRRVCSSETGGWGELPSMRCQGEFSMEFAEHPSVLVGRSLLYSMSTGTVRRSWIMTWEAAT
ncbi:hypothetical protein VPH35_063767 [Triticum aestivum]